MTAVYSKSRSYAGRILDTGLEIRACRNCYHEQVLLVRIPCKVEATQALPLHIAPRLDSCKPAVTYSFCLAWAVLNPVTQWNRHQVSRTLHFL